MKKIIILLYWFLPFTGYAQNNAGIQFTNLKNWREVLALAKKESKPIFIDAYTTWCGPCRMMDRDVWTNKHVADFVNATFIAVKVQMDSTKGDDDFIKGWRTDAATWKLYATAFPCFLFYTADGKYSGKEEGYYNPKDFLVLLKKNLDPKGSYLAQLTEYREGKLDKNQILNLAYWAKNNKDDSTAYELAKCYKTSYVDKAPIDSLLNPKINRFQFSFHKLFGLNDKLIRFMYEHPELADQKLDPTGHSSKNLTDFFITRDYINNTIYQNKLPISIKQNWKLLEDTIANLFDRKTAKRVILNSRITHAYAQKDWTEAVKLEFEKIDIYGMDKSDMGKLGINNLIYEYSFKHIDDAKLLKKSAALMKIVIESDSIPISANLDTYACILYKVGKKKEAIATEKKALDLAVKAKETNDIEIFTKTIEKMKNNEPIWKM